MKENDQLEKTEILISQVLRWGIFLCAFIIFLGWATSSNKIIMAGLLMLIFLPIGRVLAALLLFFKQKDFIYVGLSAYVLIILIASLLMGKQL